MELAMYLAAEPKPGVWSVMIIYHGRDKRFCPPNRKLTARGQHVVCGQGGEEILLKEAATAAARRCIDRMIEFG